MSWPNFRYYTRQYTEGLMETSVMSFDVQAEIPTRHISIINGNPHHLYRFRRRYG